MALGAALGALVLVAVLVLLLAGGGGDKPGASGEREASAKPPPPPQLPRGGRTLLPDKRIVAFYGAPQDDELGELGIGSPSRAARRLTRQARGYQSKTRGWGGGRLGALEGEAMPSSARPSSWGVGKTHA